MSKPVSLLDFIRLGESLALVRNPRPFHANAVKDAMDSLLSQLTACGLTGTRTAADPFSRWSLPFNPATGFIGGTALEQIVSAMEFVDQSLTYEVGKRNVIEYDPNTAPTRLRDIETTQKLTTSQTYLRDETVRCFEREAYRAAIVMGWCFAYDVIRQWVYSDATRLASFNAELAKYTNKKSGARQYADIVHYDDFFSNKAPGEGMVIEVCEAANLFGGRVVRDLRHFLDKRNDYAHANAAQPSLQQATAYVEHLIDIVTAPPFHQPPPPT
jgi:hypothetical protein